MARPNALDDSIKRCTESKASWPNCGPSQLCITLKQQTVPCRLVTDLLWSISHDYAYCSGIKAVDLKQLVTVVLLITALQAAAHIDSSQL
jgi:hypothetical protein